MAEQEVRYCTTEDNVQIAYTVSGEGPPLLVVPPVWVAFSLEHELHSYVALLQAIAPGRTLIQFDLRGSGLSQRDITDASIESQSKDVQAVLGVLSVDRAAILAGGPSGGVAIALAAQHPSRAVTLIVFGTAARSTNPSWIEGLILMSRGNWPSAARTIAGANLRRPPAEATAMANIYLRSTSGETVAQYLEQYIPFDLTSVLHQITARTLVIHSREDTTSPFTEAQHIAARVPGARLLPLEGNQSLSSLGDNTGQVADAINSFLNEDPETRALPVAPAATHTSDSVRTVLFTDLVGHTEMMSRLGDERGRAVLRDHERITREVLKARGGTEIKTMGDGFMASFGSVTRAVECAVALQRAFADHDGEALNVRVGLNAGEPIEEDGDLFGATVILASRIAAKAEGGEILVADTVRGLCSGKGFLFADRGEFVAKGFEEPVRVYEVRWRDG